MDVHKDQISMFVRNILLHRESYCNKEALFGARMNKTINDGMEKKTNDFINTCLCRKYPFNNLKEIISQEYENN